jgi:prepilin-type N-terminal cleavage/methylation domain-containing protein
MMKLKTKNTSGFTLIEVAMVLVIVGLVITAFLTPLTAQIDQKNYSEARAQLADSKEAIMGYALANKHLPCPDKTAGANNGVNDNPNDGIEDFNAAGNCIAYDGNLPWATLSLPRIDPWGQPLLYHVTTAFAQRLPLVLFGLSTNGSLRVCNEQACNAPRLTDYAVATIITKGKNGGNCSTLPSPPACVDERENDDADGDFVSHTQTASGTSNGEYDDKVEWLSSNVLFNRMVAAGKLP